ncbi:PLP-dependent aminotransferase family protein [Arsenicicoccus bolidensis]|uniref:MocR-like transcription factor YczR n=1 Tax=Arsenicicoccus bolidensis TaxID=229480 RepID=UPI000492A3BA|nr:PLP-dependent aminotransferase family protein [Arsenicicoccus bolidensis]
MTPRRLTPHRLAQQLGPAGPGVPAYRWLADGIRLLVADGRVLPDTTLPGERALTAQLGVSRTTVARAYADLVERGYAEARQGSGTRTRLPGPPAPAGEEPFGLQGRTLSGDAPPTVADLTATVPPAVPGLVAAFERAIAQLPRYLAGSGYHPAGLPVLREAVAEHYAARGVPTTPDQVIITSGALAGVAAVLRALASPGDRVVLESPSYPNSIAALQRQGSRPVAVPMIEDGFDVEGIVTAAAASRARAALLIPDFHNPTGHLLDDDGRALLVRGLARAGVPLVVDETPIDMALDAPVLPRPVAAHGPAISVGSCSKSHWGGLRLGWVRTEGPLLAAVQQARLSLDLGAPVLEQIALADLLRHPQPDTERRAALVHQRDSLHALVTATLPGWEAQVPRGGLSLWWRLPQPRSSALVTAAARRGVRLAPGAAFSPDRSGLEGYLRTPFTQPVETLERAVAAIAAAWAEIT